MNFEIHTTTDNDTKVWQVMAEGLFSLQNFYYYLIWSDFTLPRFPPCFFFFFLNSLEAQILPCRCEWSLVCSGSADILAEERWPCITIRMSCSLIPSVFNNLILVSPASLYQRNLPPVSFSVGWQFIFLLAKPCEVWLAEEAQLGGSPIMPPGLLSTDEEPIQSRRLTNASAILFVENVLRQPSRMSKGSNSFTKLVTTSLARYRSHNSKPTRRL